VPVAPRPGGSQRVDRPSHSRLDASGAGTASKQRGAWRALLVDELVFDRRAQIDLYLRDRGKQVNICWQYDQ
jgi:hypothetical protein